ncbi:BrnT family toxin [Acidicapsa acidisoli]|uniref:BrnT family toxin n=1 Tax=Acidicapsa acidisoli TaxID=1615681 RepID=UPI0037C0F46F
MEITFDPAKNERNLRLRGISFERVAEFDFNSATFDEDKRKDYGEIRTRALGYIGDTLHALVFTLRDGKIRVISLRKANRKERDRYAKARS